MSDQDPNEPKEQKESEDLSLEQDETNSKKVDLDEVDELERLEEENKEMNSTMMAIDVGGLDFDSATSTRINVEGEEAAPSDDQIIQEQLEQKKSFLSKLIGKLKPAKKQPSSTQNKKPLQIIRTLEGVWWPELNQSAVGKITFILSRLVLLGVSILLHQILVEQVQLVLEAQSPWHLYLVGFFALEVILCLFALAFRWAPTWIVTLPLFTLVAWVTAIDYLVPNASLDLFSIFGQNLQGSLNGIYLASISTLMIFFLLGVLKKVFSRILFFFLFLVVLFPFVLNVVESVEFHQSFFVAGFLQGVLPIAFQPLPVVTQTLFPLLILITLIFVFTESKKGASHFRVSRSLIFPFLAITSSLMVMLNLYFVPNVYSLFMGESSQVGVSELKLNQSILRVETKHYNKASLDDELQWLNLDLKASPKKNEFILYVQTPRRTPLPTFTAKDLRVFLQKESLPIKSFSLVDVNEKGLSKYNLVVTVPQTTQLILVDDVQKQYKTSDTLKIKLSKDHEANRVVLKNNQGMLFYQKNVTQAANQIDVPLFTLLPGKYTYSVEALAGEEDLLETQSISFEVVENKAVQLVYPLQTGLGADHSQVVLQNVDFDSQQVSKVLFKINEEVVAEYPMFQNVYSFEPAILEKFSAIQGTAALTVEVTIDQGVLSDSVSFQNTNPLQGYALQSPTMGQYVSDSLDVKLAEGSAAIKTISFYLNGLKFDRWKQKSPTEYNLDLSQWKKNQIYLTVLIESVDGAARSDWVQINRGQGRLFLSMDEKKLQFLIKRNLSILIDSSNTTRDAWQGQSILNQIKSLLVSSTVVAQLNQIDTTVITSNQEKLDSKECSLAKVVYDQKKVLASQLRESLEKVQAAGRGGGLNLLRKALDESADQVIFLTDGLSQCHSTSSIKKWVAKNTKSLPLVDVVVLSQNQKRSTFVKAMQEFDHVNVHYPNSQEFLRKTFLDLLSVQVHIKKEGKRIWNGLLKEQYIDLAPGSYKMVVVSGGDQREFDFEISNSVLTKMTLSSKKESLLVQIENSDLNQSQ